MYTLSWDHQDDLSLFVLEASLEKNQSYIDWDTVAQHAYSLASEWFSFSRNPDQVLIARQFVACVTSSA